jgi:DNA phosphorothioation-associated putative methyltransferase
MDLSLYRQELDSIAFGKRLPGAIYIVRPTLTQVPALLWELLRRAELAAQPDPQWNLLKLHSDQLALTFLTYPDFDPDPHPALAEATKINLNTGSVVRTDYRSRLNPPILHRKETFLPPDDPRHDAFAELTRQEEAAVCCAIPPASAPACSGTASSKNISSATRVTASFPPSSPAPNPPTPPRPPTSSATAQTPPPANPVS